MAHDSFVLLQRTIAPSSVRCIQPWIGGVNVAHPIAEVSLDNNNKIIFQSQGKSQSLKIK